MAIAYVGGAIGESTSGSSTTTANFGTPPSVGSIISLMVMNDSSRTVSSIVDSGGNTYTVRRSVTTGWFGWRMYHYEAEVASSATPFSVTVNWSGTHTIGVIDATEISGALLGGNAYDVGADQFQTTSTTRPGTGTDAISSGSTGTPSSDGQMVMGYFVRLGGYANHNQGTGYTDTGRQAFISATTDRFQAEYKVQSTAAAVAATFTTDGDGDYFCIVGTFKAASGYTPPVLPFVTVQFRAA